MYNDITLVPPWAILRCCRLINSLLIILQKDLIIKSSFINIYVYDCHVNHIYIYIYMFTARTMTK